MIKLHKEDEGGDGIILVSVGALEAQEFIEQMFANIPDKRKKRLYARWLGEINDVIRQYNKNYGNIYKEVK